LVVETHQGYFDRNLHHVRMWWPQD